MPEDIDELKKELAQEILEFAATLARRITRQTKTGSLVKVRISKGVTRKVAYVAVDERFRATIYGLVPSHTGTVNVIRDSSDLFSLQIMELVDTRRALFELVEHP
jgi:hypothetical protein